jgi:hypothetical protein
MPPPCGGVISVGRTSPRPCLRTGENVSGARVWPARPDKVTTCCERRAGGAEVRGRHKHDRALVQRPLPNGSPVPAGDRFVRRGAQTLVKTGVWRGRRSSSRYRHDLEEAVFVGTGLMVLSQYDTDDRADIVARGARIVCELANRATQTRRKRNSIRASRRRSSLPALWASSRTICTTCARSICRARTASQQRRRRRQRRTSQLIRFPPS